MTGPGASHHADRHLTADGLPAGYPAPPSWQRLRSGLRVTVVVHGLPEQAAATLRAVRESLPLALVVVPAGTPVPHVDAAGPGATRAVAPEENGTDERVRVAARGEDLVALALAGRPAVVLLLPPGVLPASDDVHRMLAVLDEMPAGRSLVRASGPTGDAAVCWSAPILAAARDLRAGGSLQELAVAAGGEAAVLTAETMVAPGSAPAGSPGPGGRPRSRRLLRRLLRRGLL